MSPQVPDAGAVESMDVDAITAWMSTRREEMVHDLSALVDLETPSDDLALLQKGCDWVENWVTGHLGAPEGRRRYDSEEHGPVLVLDYDGAGERRVVGLGHYDTVFDAGTVDERPAAVDGDRITGPGVFDMKAGLVQLIFALRALTEAGVGRPPMRLVFNGDEEIGSPFSRPIIEEESAGAAAVLVLEASAEGAVKTARKGVGLFEVHATGVESHAGLDPEAGASAVGEIAHVVTTLHEATDHRVGTTVNVGVIRGGRRRNVVAGSATAALDVRVATFAEQERIDSVLASLVPRDPRVALSVKGGWNRPVMTRTDAVAAMYELARGIGARLDMDLAEISVGGASDGNFVAALGLPVLDGIGAVGAGAHAAHEWVSISGMVERSTLLAGVMSAFAEQ